MGQKSRPKPIRLPEKLLAIRQKLGLSQQEMAERLSGVPSPPQPAFVSRFERGEREPDLLILLEYARLAGVHLEVLVDDSLDLPVRIPGRKRF